MEYFWQAVAAISEPPGSLVYHLVLLFALELAAVIAVRQVWRERSWASLRVLLAAGSTSLVALITLAAALLSALNFIDTLLVLPPLARVASTLLVLVMLWFFLFPQPSRWGDGLAAGLTLMFLIAAAVGWALWAQDVRAGAQFFSITPQGDASLPDTIWVVAQLALLLVGIVALLILLSLSGRRPHPDAGAGLVLFGLLLAGYALHYLTPPSNSNLPGAVRLAEIVAIPLFAAIVFRRASADAPAAVQPSVVVLPTTQGELAAVLPPETRPAAEPPPAASAEAPAAPSAPGLRAIDPKAAVALATLNASASPDELAQIITLAVAHTCRAELCLLITPPDEAGMITILSAYDLVLEQFVTCKPFPAQDMLETRAALMQSVATPLPLGSASAELRRFSNAVGRSQIGPTLIVPLRAENELIGALVMMALYSSRDWTPADYTLVNALLGPISDALGGDSKLSRLLHELETTQSLADAAEEARRMARSEADQLALALETARVEAERLNTDILQLRAEMEAQGPPTDAFDDLRQQFIAEQSAQIIDMETDWRAQLEHAESEAAREQQRAFELENELQQRRTEAGDWRHKYEEALHEFEGRIQRDVELHTELERLRAQVQALTAQADEIEALRAQAKTHAAAASEIDTLRAAALAAAAQLAEAEQLRATNQTQAADLERLRAQVETLSTQLEQARSAPAPATHPAEAPPELEQLRAEAQTASEWRAQFGRATARAEAAAQHEAELVRELDQLRSEMHTLLMQAAEVETLRAELAQARAGQPAPEARSARENELHSEVTRLRAELASIEKNAEHLTLLEADLKSASGWREKYEASQRELNEYAQREAELARQVGRLQAERVPSEGADEAVRARHVAEINALREQLEAFQWQAAVRQFDYDFITQQEQQLRKELELTRSELRRLTDEREALPPAAPAEPRSKPTTEEIGTVTKALNETKAQLAGALTELAEQRTALDETRRVLSDRERQLTKAQSIVASLNDQSRQLGEVQSELNDVLKRYADAQAAAEAKTTQLAQMERELADAMAALAELSTQTQTLTQTQQQLVEKERQLDEAHSMIATGPLGERAESAAPLPFLPQASMEVIASLTQELRQPISAIGGYSELLLGESVGILGALQRKFLERVKASCERMEALLHDLIRVTDIDSGTLQLVPESLDVMYVVDDAILSCSAQYREKGLNLRMDLGESLPPVSADRDALRQIIGHLLTNAGNASRNEGDVVLRVRSEAAPGLNGNDHAALFISVRDSGSGIAPEDQPRVFQRFYRADAPLIAGLGDTGVGLSVAKALVEAHGGRIWLTSEAGQGSTFNVLLPVTPPRNSNGRHSG
jgi:signal transduction histidine kinase